MSRCEIKPDEGRIISQKDLEHMEKLLREGKKLEVAVRKGELAVWEIKSVREI